MQSHNELFDQFHMNACVIYDNILMFHTQNKVEKMFLEGQFDSLSNEIGVPHVKPAWVMIVSITRYIKVLQIQLNENWPSSYTLLMRFTLWPTHPKHQYPNSLIN
jgi:hypothetical protein